MLAGKFKLIVGIHPALLSYLSVLVEFVNGKVLVKDDGS